MNKATDAIMVFMQGMIFVGVPSHKLSEHATEKYSMLKDAYQLNRLTVTTREGMMPMNVLLRIGELNVPNLDSYPSSPVTKDSNKEIYEQYVQLSTGIDLTGKVH